VCNLVLQFVAGLGRYACTGTVSGAALVDTLYVATRQDGVHCPRTGSYFVIDYGIGNDTLVFVVYCYGNINTQCALDVGRNSRGDKGSTSERFVSKSGSENVGGAGV